MKKYNRFALCLAVFCLLLTLFGFFASALAQADQAAQEPAAEPAELRELPDVGLDGFPWLTPARGEKLYIGEAKVSQAKLVYLMFIISADGNALEDLLILVHLTDIVVDEGDVQYHLSDHSFRRTYSGTQLFYGNTFDMDLKDLTLKNITIEGETAHCEMAFVYQYPGSDNGDVPPMAIPFDVVTVEMENYALMPVNPAVAPPKASDVSAMGFELPVPAAGETLYLGEADVSQAERLFVAFLLSEDGTEMRDVTFYISGMEASFRLDSTTTIQFSSTSVTQTINGSFAVGSEAVSLGNSKLMDMTVAGEEATGTLAFVYHYSGSLDAGAPEKDVSFDWAQVRFTAQ